MPHNHYPLTEFVRNQSIELLGKNLATVIDLHSQVKTALWNVKLVGLVNIRRQLQIDAKVISEFSEELAARISTLGGIAHGSVQFAAANSCLIPYNIEIASEEDHAFAISASLSAFSQSLTSAIATCYEIQDFNSAETLINMLQATDSALRRLTLYMDANHKAPQHIEAGPAEDDRHEGKHGHNKHKNRHGGNQDNQLEKII